MLPSKHTVSSSSSSPTALAKVGVIASYQREKQVITSNLSLSETILRQKVRVEPTNSALFWTVPAPFSTPSTQNVMAISTIEVNRSHAEALRISHYLCTYQSESNDFVLEQLDVTHTPIIKRIISTHETFAEAMSRFKTFTPVNGEAPLMPADRLTADEHKALGQPIHEGDLEPQQQRAIMEKAAKEGKEEVALLHTSRSMRERGVRFQYSTLKDGTFYCHEVSQAPHLPGFFQLKALEGCTGGTLYMTLPQLLSVLNKQRFCSVELTGCVTAAISGETASPPPAETKAMVSVASGVAASSSALSSLSSAGTGASAISPWPKAPPAATPLGIRAAASSVEMLPLVGAVPKPTQAKI